MTAAWLGMEVTDMMFWVDGSEVDYELWKDGEPDNVLTEGDSCMRLRYGLMADRQCFHEFYYICQREPELATGKLCFNRQI